jgi:hypothetical protein
MIDVNKITSVLAKLPDPQLQQYAQIHKSDPYIMALAMSESNRRKEIRSAGLGAQGLQEQPKVVDQMVAEMATQQAPEDQGIGQLPAGDMNFAGGGIIAFADGGDVERYQYGGETTFDPFTGVPVYDPASQVGADDRTLFERLGVFNPENRRALEQAERNMALRGKPSPTAPPAAAVAKEAEAPVGVAAAQAKPTPSAERAPVTGGLSSIDALQQKYFGDFDTRKTELKGMREGLVQGIKDLTASNLAETQAEIAARGDVYKGREERLSKQEKDIEGMGDRYLGIALLQAGAAMMSTPGGLAAALGKGATVGAERYAAGLDKINAAQAKFAEAKDRLDDLRINRDDMNSKEIRAAKREAKAADLRGQELMLSGFEKDWGVERDMLGKIFTAANEDLQTTRRIQAQKETAGKQDTNEKMRSAVLTELQAKYPNDPAKVAAEFNKTFAKTEDLEAYYRKKQLDQLAEAKVKSAGMPGGGIPGQTEKLDALERQLIGGRGGALTTKAQYDALPKGASYTAPDGTMRIKG